MNMHPKAHLGFLAITLACVLSAARAHEPLEISARMAILRDRMELRVSAGSDAARLHLKQQGFSPAEIAGMTRPFSHKPTLIQGKAVPSVAFYQLRSAGKLITPDSWEVISADTEIIFTARYPRPPVGTLEVSALFFGLSPEMKPGMFAAFAPPRKLAASLLSKESPSLRILVPQIDPPTTEQTPHKVPILRPAIVEEP